MSKILVYIGEEEKFELDATISAISTIRGVRNAKRGNFIGSVFECEYAIGGASTIVRISSDRETVSVEGLGDESLGFALELQRRIPISLYAIDMEYSFNISLQKMKSVEQFRKSIT